MPEQAPQPALLSVPAAIGLVAGFAVFLLTLIAPPPGDLPVAGWRTLGLAAMMAIWWSTEPIPIGITALLPLIVVPLAGIMPIAKAAAPYANPLVFLFMGGFLLASGVKRWGLHRRLAHSVVRTIGLEPRRLVLGFMVASGLLSMWISNTAAVVLMLPVAVSIITVMEENEGKGENVRRFALSLLLGLAYGASIGGVGTLIGTPPNALLAGYLFEQHGIDLSFAAWSAVAIPLVIVFMPIAWLVLTRVIYPVAGDFAAAMRTGGLIERLAVPGPMTAAERRVALVFVAAASLWITRPLLNQVPGLEALSDPAIAIFCGAILFLIPAGITPQRRFLMSWDDAAEIPWHVLILFGGGLSLAAAMDASGLAKWIGSGLAGLGDLPMLGFLLVLTATVVLLTELASNTATVAALLPIVATIAAGTGIDLITISAVVAMAASCAFMLPVATPPNALVFGTGHVTVAAMMRAGFVMNILSVVLVALAALALAPLLRTMH
ncbi:MAG: anion transporter [Hyphomicrobiales bacterium]|nr:MAG: anion transporter [Hyphomicrobiales bacterium]